MPLSEKRAAAQKAEADFFALLKESGLAKQGAVWKEVSHVLSSSRRQPNEHVLE